MLCSAFQLEMYVLFVPVECCKMPQRWPRLFSGSGFWHSLVKLVRLKAYGWRVKSVIPWVLQNSWWMDVSFPKIWQYEVLTHPKMWMLIFDGIVIGYPPANKYRFRKKTPCLVCFSERPWETSMLSPLRELRHKIKHELRITTRMFSKECVHNSGSHSFCWFKFTHSPYTKKIPELLYTYIKYDWKICGLRMPLHCGWKKPEVFLCGPKVVLQL